MSRFWLLAISVFGPFAIWAAVRAAVGHNLFTPESVLRVLRAWRWIMYISAFPLGLFYIFPPHIRWQYALCASTFSLGLSFPESWLKGRFCSADKNAPVAQ